MAHISVLLVDPTGEENGVSGPRRSNRDSRL